MDIGKRRRRNWLIGIQDESFDVWKSSSYCNCTSCNLCILGTCNNHLNTLIVS